MNCSNSAEDKQDLCLYLNYSIQSWRISYQEGIQFLLPCLLAQPQNRVVHTHLEHTTGRVRGQPLSPESVAKLKLLFRNAVIHQSGITFCPLTGEVNNADYLFIMAAVRGWDILGRDIWDTLKGQA